MTYKLQMSLFIYANLTSIVQPCSPVEEEFDLEKLKKRSLSHVGDGL